MTLDTGAHIERGAFCCLALGEHAIAYRRLGMNPSGKNGSGNKQRCQPTGLDQLTHRNPPLALTGGNYCSSTGY
jgi:hypothetical protein